LRNCGGITTTACHQQWTLASSNPQYIETAEERVLEVKGSHFFAEWLSVEGHEEHLNSVDEPRIGHSDLGYVYRVRLPN
jgi:hypothetical protein